jgi:Prokaryotic lipoprotein-attachment site
MNARLFPLIGALGIALALASCGVKTGLERPAPMFGKARQNYLAEQERLKAEAAARAAAGAPAPEVPPPPPPNQPLGRTPISPTASPPSAP